MVRRNYKAQILFHRKRPILTIIPVFDHFNLNALTLRLQCNVMKNWISVLVLFIGMTQVFGQQRLEQKNRELYELRQRENQLLKEIEELKLEACLNMMQMVGYPQADREVEIVEHAAMVIGFDCEYKMASWVFHVLTPDVSFGNVTRTNDFRPDELMTCGSAVEADFFMRKEKPDGTFGYDGFGFDRGHLAPSADFRWSATALSESYYYTNMSPQRPEFNRESWAELEGLLRRIVDQEKKTFYVITGPVLRADLPQVPRSVNGLSIPELHYKIIVDVSEDQPRGMAFLMPNRKADQRLSNYVVSIDSVERLTGLNFFPLLSKEMEELIEGKADFAAWQTQAKEGDVEPFKATELPKGHFNTEQARLKVGQTVTIVGKVVSTKFLDKSQATFLNLDQSFPNQLFTVIIWKDGRRNFSYRPEVELDGIYIAVTGKVELDKNGVPGITVTKETQIVVWE
jgi:endonuclease G, mitochondrial